MVNQCTQRARLMPNPRRPRPAKSGTKIHSSHIVVGSEPATLLLYLWFSHSPATVMRVASPSQRRVTLPATILVSRSGEGSSA
jgi:hypothetical protein